VKIPWCLDDKITLENGEAALSLLVERCIRQAALVIEVVVFGIERLIPELLLF
jgi:hypothetical protein